ncbi:cob(I)yrinic acid a,c-diamide adenosyltransferase [Candidatus Peregrinibacteria bacterium]|jgi:cob(I)alamin adenosyltransferase|nr:cob(I)yrinic acid a,c-diamide adenosyltransferase [Candidatus Peregrinibacteria bacterium]
MAIYTRKGDDGTTDLISGRAEKDALRISTIGTLDELNSILGISRAKTSLQNVGEAIKYLQGAIFDISASIVGNEKIKIPEAKNLEEVIDEIEKMLPPLTNFILPGGHEGAAYLHHARSTCRRVERLVVALNKREGIDKNIITFINRTSDFLFILARYVNNFYMIQEVTWDSEGVHVPEEEAKEEKEMVAENQITVEEAVEAVETGEDPSEKNSQEVSLPPINEVKKAKKKAKKGNEEQKEEVAAT